MGLKSLSPRHYDIMRRLIIGQTPHEISIELGISRSRISILKDDRLFDSEFQKLSERVIEGFIETRADAMQILEDAAPEAAMLVRDAIKGVEIGGKKPSLNLRMKSAWDCLDRTGNKGVEKSVMGYINLADLINEAYQKKYKDKQNENDEKVIEAEVTETALIAVEGQHA